MVRTALLSGPGTTSLSQFESASAAPLLIQMGRERPGKDYSKTEQVESAARPGSFPFAALAWGNTTSRHPLGAHLQQWGPDAAVVSGCWCSPEPCTHGASLETKPSALTAEKRLLRCCWPLPEWLSAPEEGWALSCTKESARFPPAIAFAADILLSA